MKKYFVLFAMLCMLSAVCLSSCASTQRITVKQEQEGQMQETIIESDTKINTFSMVIRGNEIEYNGSVYRPRRERSESTREPEKQMTSDVRMNWYHVHWV